MLVQLDPSLQPADTAELFQKFDIDKNNTVSLDEFQRMVIDTDYTGIAHNHMLDQLRAKKLIKKLIDTIIANDISVN